MTTSGARRFAGGSVFLTAWLAVTGVVALAGAALLIVVGLTEHPVKHVAALTLILVSHLLPWIVGTIFILPRIRRYARSQADAEEGSLLSYRALISMLFIAYLSLLNVEVLLCMFWRK